jgi:hypothetical protein
MKAAPDPPFLALRLRPAPNIGGASNAPTVMNNTTAHAESEMDVGLRPSSATVIRTSARATFLCRPAR